MPSALQRLWGTESSTAWGWPRRSRRSLAHLQVLQDLPDDAEKTWAFSSMLVQYPRKTGNNLPANSLQTNHSISEHTCTWRCISSEIRPGDTMAFCAWNIYKCHFRTGNRNLSFLTEYCQHSIFLLFFIYIIICKASFELQCTKHYTKEWTTQYFIFYIGNRERR